MNIFLYHIHHNHVHCHGHYQWHSHSSLRTMINTKMRYRIYPFPDTMRPGMVYHNHIVLSSALGWRRGVPFERVILLWNQDAKTILSELSATEGRLGASLNPGREEENQMAVEAEVVQTFREIELGYVWGVLVGKRSKCGADGQTRSNRRLLYRKHLQNKIHFVKGCSSIECDAVYVDWLMCKWRTLDVTQRTDAKT